MIKTAQILIIFMALVGLAILTIPTHAATFDEISDQANKLTWYDSCGNVSINMTAEHIEKWILDNIGYKFGACVRGVKYAWEEREGDCTERAMLAGAMFKAVNISADLKHGYMDGEKHDWIEVGGYRLFCTKNITEIGKGVWR
jgi:hypothetical protein